MCDLCKKKDPCQYRFSYKSKYYKEPVAVYVCGECAEKIRKAGGVNKYLEENKHE